MMSVTPLVYNYQVNYEKNTQPMDQGIPSVLFVLWLLTIRVFKIPQNIIIILNILMEFCVYLFEYIVVTFNHRL